MDDLDRLLNEEKKSTPLSISDLSTPSVETSQYVVIDEKTFHPGQLINALKKGDTTLSFKNGKGLRITNFPGKDSKGRTVNWVSLQVLEAGIGKKVKTQQNFANKPKTQKSSMSFDKAEGGTKKAW